MMVTSCSCSCACSAAHCVAVYWQTRQQSTVTKGLVGACAAVLHLLLGQQHPASLDELAAVVVLIEAEASGDAHMEQGVPHIQNPAWV